MGWQALSCLNHGCFNGPRGVIHPHRIKGDASALDQDAGLPCADELTRQ
jgi:hypothetical protein